MRGIVGLALNNRLRKIIVYVILGLLVVVGVVNMASPLIMRGEIDLFGNDPWIEYWLTKYLVEHGITSWWSLKPPNPDVLKFWYPYGRDFTMTAYPGVPMFAALTYPIGKALGLTIKEWVAVNPIIFGAIAIIAAFLFGRELFGNNYVGLVYSAFMVALASGTARSFVGFVEKQGYGVALILLAMFFYIRLLKYKRWFDAVLSGLFLGLTFWFWGGYIFAYTLVAMHIALLPFVTKIDKKTLNLLTILAIVTYIISLAYGVPEKLLKTELSLSILAALALVYVYNYVLNSNRKHYLGLIIALGIGVIVAAALRLISVPGRVLYALGILTDVKPIVATVAEHARPEGVAVEMYVALPLAILGILYSIYKLLSKPNEKWLLIVLSSTFMLYLYSRMAYLSEIGLVFSLLAVLAITHWSITVLQRATKYRVGSLTKVFAILVLGLLLLFIPNAAILTFASRSNMNLGLDIYGNAWIDMLDWIKENTPEDSVIVAWWDYGYWITVNTNRATLADGATWNTTQIWLLSKILMGNESHAVEVMKRYFHLQPNKTYVLAYYIAIALNNTTMLVLPGQADIGKSNAMLFIMNGPNGPRPTNLENYSIEFNSKILPKYWYTTYYQGRLVPLTPKWDMPGNQLPLLYKLTIDSVYELGYKFVYQDQYGRLISVPRPYLQYFKVAHISYDQLGVTVTGHPYYVVVFLYQYVGEKAQQEA